VQDCLVEVNDCARFKKAARIFRGGAQQTGRKRTTAQGEHPRQRRRPGPAVAQNKKSHRAAPSPRLWGRLRTLRAGSSNAEILGARPTSDHSRRIGFLRVLRVWFRPAISTEIWAAYPARSEQRVGYSDARVK